MGTWSGEPFGNDTAGDWAYDLEKAADWGLVSDALSAVIGQAEPDSDDAVIAIAAEVVAHGLDRPTQTSASTESLTSFIQRSGHPDADLVRLAVDALAAAISPESELTELWEDDPDEWLAANAVLRQALDSSL